MNKLLSVTLALVMLAFCIVPAFAETQSMAISTEGEAAYELSYPADVEIPWSTESMGIGEIRAVLLNIEPSKAVKVGVSSANDYNLVNEKATNKTIAYTLVGDDNIVFLPGDYGKAFSLSVEIDEEQWNRAASGKHSDFLTFTAEYTDA